MVFFDIGQTANAGSHGHADAITIGIGHFNARIGQCLHAGGYAVLDEQVQLARFLGGHVRLDIEVANGAAEASAKGTDIHMFYRTDAAFAREGSLPTAVD